MELLWIGVAFVLGVLAKRLRQPPLLGFLAAGFALELLGFRPDDALKELADLGVMLLLFVIGLKLDLRSVIRPQVWGVGLLHMVLATALCGATLLGASYAGLNSLAGLTLETAALLGFALSFSSTVFAVKLLEERDDTSALYGRIGVGILIVQDLAAVAFMVASSGKLPSLWALGLVLLIPARPLFHRLLDACGHGELLVLAGLAATLGGAGLFYAVGLKGDLGALVAGVLLGGAPRAKELSKSLAGLKDVFLVGFFLMVGLTGLPTLETTLVALGLVLVGSLKGILFFLLLARFRLRARTSLFAAASLSQFSEFGLIVGALAVSKEWLGKGWLITIAMAVAFSFLLSTALNNRVYDLYRTWRERLRRYETERRVPEEEPMDASGAEVLVFGMGRVGSGAYDRLLEAEVGTVMGFDLNEDVVERHRTQNRNVLLASATDVDFWQRLHVDPERVRLILLAMSSHVDNLEAIEQLRQAKFPGFVAATARYDDEISALVEAGADAAYHVMGEAGSGLAEHALDASGRYSRLAVLSR